MDEAFSHYSQFSQVLESQLQQNENDQDHLKKTRKGNYVPEEDEALVRSWLHISENVIVGRDKKSARLWERILETFHKLLGKTTERNGQGLQNRWQLISHDISKFCGYYNKIGRLNPSGWNEEMKIAEAKKDFGEIEGPLQKKPVPFYRFKFEHCWKLLKNSPKWNENVLIRICTTKAKNPTQSKLNTTNVENTSIPLSSTPISINDDFSPDNEANLIRPEGRRKSKAKRKKEEKDDEANLFLKGINDTLKETVIIEKEKWEAKKKRDEGKTLNQEWKVMSLSMEGFTPELQTYWKMQQSIIMERNKKIGLAQEDNVVNDIGSDFDLNA